MTKQTKTFIIMVIQKGCEKEEYIRIPVREDCSSAERRSWGRLMEGSFGAGILNLRQFLSRNPRVICVKDKREIPLRRLFADRSRDGIKKVVSRNLFSSFIWLQGS